MNTTMKALLLFLCIAVSSTATWAASLVLETEKQLFRVGETMTIVLRLEDVTVTPSPDGISGFVAPAKGVIFPSQTSDAGFVYRIRLRANQEGEKTLGPFVVNFAGQVLKSNVTTVRVIPAGFRGVEVHVDRNQVKVGEEFVVLLRCPGMKENRVRWRDNRLVKAGPPEYSTSSTTAEGRTTSSTIFEFHLTALHPGTLSITSASFSDIPAEADYEPVKVEIVAR